MFDPQELKEYLNEKAVPYQNTATTTPWLDPWTIQEALRMLAKEARPTRVEFATGNVQDDLTRYGLCLVIEAAELVNALPWKKWARKEADPIAILSEFADLLAFLGSMTVLLGELGIDPETIALAYRLKAFQNRERFQTRFRNADLHVLAPD